MQGKDVVASAEYSVRYNPACSCVVQNVINFILVSVILINESENDSNNSDDDWCKVLFVLSEMLFKIYLKYLHGKYAVAIIVNSLKMHYWTLYF